MKTGVLVGKPINPSKNIGDYIQSVAGKQFCPNFDYYIDRENLASFGEDNYEEKVRVILNAWFMWHPEEWPPSQIIDPLLISVHLSPLVRDMMVCGEGWKYLKKHEPIGCRDVETKEYLEKKGINSYFSGCLTLTLGKTFQSGNNRKKIYFVEPYTPEGSKNKIKKLNYASAAIITAIKNPVLVNRLRKKDMFKTYRNFPAYNPDGSLYYKWKTFIRSVFRASLFVTIYSKRFTISVLREAEYITHVQYINVNDEAINEKCMLIAEELIKKYADAAYVITSRIHCALPCLGVNTPVVFTNNPETESQNWNSGRLNGLTDFFRSFSVDNLEMKTRDEVFSKIHIFDVDTKFSNKDNWKPYADNMIRQCEKFFNQDL